MKPRVYNYITMKKVREFEEHQWYNFCVEISSTLPYIQSCSDDIVDQTLGLEYGFLLYPKIFEDYAHYIMQV